MATDTRRRTRITVAAVVLLAGVIAVPVANGAVSGQEGGSDAKGQGNHCTLNAKTGETRCFKSLSKATGVPGSDRLLDAPSGKKAEVSEARSGDKPVASSGVTTQDEGGGIIGATVFEDTKYGGASLTITNTELCDGDADDVDFKIDLGDDWKDKISSIQPWGNCTLNLYSEAGQSGDRDGPFDELTPDIGDVMDDRTKSISFS
ncbi:hypothetical protein [Streptomyces winkii]|uniref:hypothetical protein n=1 Tax=Streptomyces winkii TaxID=3051178 RepID=UPI0028D3841C|nr:hypothetical protein [Streptomyces sp. DSM 40971]